MTQQEAYATYLELRESTADGEQSAGLSHTSEGLVLFHVLEVAAHGEPRGIVTIVHDAGEHGGRYEKVAHALAEQNFAVALPDMRGHGRSEGARGHSTGMREVYRDLDEVQNHLAYRLPEAPKFLVGHGLGAVYCAHYALENPRAIAGLVLAAPLVEPKFELPEAKKGLLSMFGKKVGPESLGAINWSVDRLTRSAGARSELELDELRHNLISVRAAEEAGKAAASCLPRLSELSIPCLLLQGTADDIAPSERALQLKGCEVKQFEGMKHGLFVDDGSDQVMKTLVDWIGSKV